jgi:site-specific DNA recombinase
MERCKSFRTGPALLTISTASFNDSSPAISHPLASKRLRDRTPQGWSLDASHADERRYQEDAIRRHQAEHKRIGGRINAMYLDKLDGRVDSEFFDKRSAQWREEQNRCLREIETHEGAEQSYMDEGVQILELARSAQKLFEQQQSPEKRRLLNFVLSNCSWEDGEVVATIRQPFDFFAQTTAIATRAATSSLFPVEIVRKEPI